MYTPTVGLLAIPRQKRQTMSDQHAEYVAALERVADLARTLMMVAYDDGPEEIALCEALAEARRLKERTNG